MKLVLLGDTGVGKSAIVVRFVQGEFSNESKVTVGAAFLAKALRIPEHGPDAAVKFEIWDTAGQERYASLAPLYYRGAGAAVMVYDITSTASFEKARFWVKELQKHASPNINMVLVGNKKDLEGRRAVTQRGRSGVRERERHGDGVRGERAERGWGDRDIQGGGHEDMAVTHPSTCASSLDS